MDKKLLQAYTTAQYWIHEPKIIFGLGDMSDLLRNYLSWIDCNRFAFITAYNPYSKGLSLGENQKRNKSLLKDLSWYNMINGAGWDLDGKREPEESFLVCNINKDIANNLAKKYEQNALLYWDGWESIDLITIEESI